MENQALRQLVNGLELALGGHFCASLVAVPPTPKSGPGDGEAWPHHRPASPNGETFILQRSGSAVWQVCVDTACNKVEMQRGSVMYAISWPPSVSLAWHASTVVVDRFLPQGYEATPIQGPTTAFSVVLTRRTDSHGWLLARDALTDLLHTPTPLLSNSDVRELLPSVRSRLEACSERLSHGAPHHTASAFDALVSTASTVLDLAGRQAVDASVPFPAHAYALLLRLAAAKHDCVFLGQNMSDAVHRLQYSHELLVRLAMRSRASSVGTGHQLFASLAMQVRWLGAVHCAVDVTRNL